MGSAVNALIPSVYGVCLFCRLSGVHAMCTLRLTLQDRRHVLHNLMQAFFPGTAIHPSERVLKISVAVCNATYAKMSCADF